MRLALCISGMPRLVRQTCGTMHTYFRDQMGDRLWTDWEKAGIFLHLWEGETSDEVIQQTRDLYRPDQIVMTPRPRADEAKKGFLARFPVSPNLSFLDEFKAIADVIAAVPAGYTHIARMRYDTIFNGRAPERLFQGGNRAVFVPDNFAVPGGCNNQFACGKTWGMRRYADMFPWLRGHVADRTALPDETFCSNPGLFKPEQALMRYLTLRGMRVESLALTLTLLREEDGGKSFDELPQGKKEDIRIVRARKRILYDAAPQGGVGGYKIA